MTISRLNMEPWMPRPRERVCLQDGLKLDLNRLARKGFVRRGANIGIRGITWTHSYWGEIATGTISADMSGKDERLVSHSAWQPRSVDYPHCHVRVISVGGHGTLFALQELARLCLMEAIRRDTVLQPPNLGPTSRLSIPIQRCNKPGPCRKGADQVATDS